MRFVFGDCELDTERYELRRAGVVALEPKAFRVLVHLLRHHGRAVAKRDLLQELWPGTSDEHYTEYSLRNCLRRFARRWAMPGRSGRSSRLYGLTGTGLAAVPPPDRPHCSGCRAAGPCGRPHPLPLSLLTTSIGVKRPTSRFSMAARQNRPSSSSG